MSISRWIALSVIAAAATVCGAQVQIGSPDQVPANSCAQGRTDYIAFGFGAVKTHLGSANFSGLTLQNLGTAQPSDWVRIRVIRDLNTNGVVDAGDAVLSSVNASAFPIVFPPFLSPDPIPLAPAASVYLIALDVAPGAQVGRTFILQLASNADFVVSPVQSVVGGPIAGNAQTITAPTLAEIDVQRITAPATSIAVGSTDNLGVRGTATPFSVTYSVLNTGADTLTLQGNPIVFLPGFSWVNCTPTLTVPPAATVPSMGSTTFTLSITVPAAGQFGFLLRMDNNDADENSYSFIVTGTGGQAPEVSLARGPAQIVANGTDTVANAQIGVPLGLSYTISNSGSGTLQIATPLAAPGGLVNCVASIVTQPNAMVPSAASTVLDVSVTPGAGPFSFTLVFWNNDSDEDPYRWTVTGNATGPEIDVLITLGATPLGSGGTHALGTLPGGTPEQLGYEVHNTGQALLLLPMGAQISNAVNCLPSVSMQLPSSIAVSGLAPLTLSVIPGAAGLFSFVVTIDNNDINENPYTWTVTGTSQVAAPEIDVQRGTLPIASGATDNAGTQPSGVPLTLNYRIENTGNGPLLLTGMPNAVIVNVGNNVNSITVSVLPANMIAPSADTTFAVTFTIGGAGPFDFTITIPNNDSNEDPYVWTVSGDGLPGVPEITVVRGTVAISNGGTDPLGNRPAGLVIALTYDIDNTGTEELNLGVPVTLSGEANCTVSAVAQPFATLPIAGSTTLGLELTPTASGPFSVTVTVVNDDPNENPFVWTISGNAQVPLSGQPGTGGGGDGGGGCDAGVSTALPLLALLAMGLVYRRKVACLNARTS